MPAFKNTADSHLRPNGQTAKRPNGRRLKQTTPRPWGTPLPFSPSLHSCNGFPPLSLSRCGFQTCHMTVPAEMSAHHLLWSLTTAGLNCKKASADSCLHNIHFLNSALSLLPPLDKRKTSSGISRMSHVSQIRKHCQHVGPRPHFSHKQQPDTVYVSTLRRVGNPQTSSTLALMSAATPYVETFYGRCVHSRTLPTLVSGQMAKRPNGQRPKQTPPRAPAPSLPFTPSLHSCNGFPPLSLSRCGFQTCHMHAPSDSRTAASLTVPAEMSAHHLLWSLTTAGLNCKKASADSCLHNIHFLHSALSLLPPLHKGQTSSGI